MNSNKFLKILILILLLVNIATISFMWVNRPTPNNKVAEFFSKELQFTASQSEAFDLLKEEHQMQRRKLMEENKQAHNAFFELLKSNDNDSIALEKAVNEITRIKKQEELILFHHFAKVRKICDDKQKIKFDEIIQEAAKMMAPRPPRQENRPFKEERHP